MTNGPRSYRSAGEGRPVLYLGDDGSASWPALLDGLARSFRIVAPAPAATSAELGAFVDAVVGTSCDAIGFGTGAALAAQLALERPDRIEHLVLAAPQGLDAGPLAARLSEIDKPTLLLRGTRDTVVPEASVQLARSRMPHAFLVYVFDAGYTLAEDQPERVFDVVSSFLTRSDAFIVNWGSLAIRR